MSDNDLELLARYTRQHLSCRNPMEADAEDAFAELVRRHLGLVYSAALRQVRSPQLAEEVTQSAFIDLARSAARLKPDTILTAWLYQVTRRTAIDVVRREASRQLREQIATEMNAMNATAADWTHIEPLLDEAMHALDDTDRTAVLLRYFENKSLREVGATLGTSENAAQKRLSRAVERLREFFAKRGVTVGGSGLVIVISANAVQAAPVGLAVTISSAAVLGGTTLTTLTTTTATKAIAMTTMQKVLVAAVIAAVGTGIYEAREASALRTQIQTLQQQPLSSEQLNQLTRELNQTASQLAVLRTENEGLKSNTAELMRLRNEVTRLRTDATLTGNNPSEIAVKAWLNRVIVLKQRLEQSPDQRIPELELLTEEDWLNVARRELSTELDYRQAFSRLRSEVEFRFGNMLSSALRKYLAANDNRFPAELSQLQPYLESPVNEAVWQRYAILPADEVRGMAIPNDKWLISQKAPVDELLDSRTVVSQFSIGAHQSGGMWRHVKEQAQRASANKTLLPVLKAFMEANGGKQFTDPAELLPFATTPEQKALLEQAVKDVNAAKAFGPKP